MCQSFWHMTVTVKNKLDFFTTYGISLIFTTLLKGDGHEEKEAQPHYSPEKRDRDYRLESREETERREWFLTRRWRGSRRNAYKYIDGYKYKYNKNTNTNWRKQTLKRLSPCSLSQWLCIQIYRDTKTIQISFFKKAVPAGLSLFPPRTIISSPRLPSSLPAILLIRLECFSRNEDLLFNQLLPASARRLTWSAGLSAMFFCSGLKPPPPS